MRMRFWTLTLFLICGTCAAADGALDVTFGNYLSGISKITFGDGSLGDHPSSVLVQPDGKLVLVGTASFSLGAHIAMTRLMPSGAVDPTFGTAGLMEYDPAFVSAEVAAAALQSDGKIVIVGSGTTVPHGPSLFMICRFGPTGVVDGLFGNAGCTTVDFGLGGNNDRAEAVAIDRNAKIVVGGFTTAASGTAVNFAFARFNTNGTLDSSFGFGASGRQVITRFDELAAATTHDILRSLVIQPDGKIIGVGATSLAPFTNWDFAAVRLDAAGLLDGGYGDGGVRTVAFDFGGSMDDTPAAAALQSDGKLVIAGYTTFTATDSDYAIVRLTADGDPDPDFGAGGKLYVGFDLGGLGLDNATAIAVQSDGKILIAGFSTNSASGGIYGNDVTICRLLPNSWLDNSFGNAGRLAIGLNLYGSNDDRAYALALHAGRPVLAGSMDAPPTGQNSFFALRLENALIFANHFDP